MNTDAPTLDDLLTHREWLRRLARSIASDPHLSADLEQEVWLKAVRSPPGRATSLRGWLGTVLRRKAIDEHRQRTRRERAVQGALPAACAPDPSVAAEERESRLLVARAVLDLPDPYRHTILLHYLGEHTVEEVARRHAVPVETVRTRLRRGRDLLRERLGGPGRSSHRALAILAWGAPERVPLSASLVTSTIGAVMTTKSTLLAAGAVVAAVIGCGIWLARSPDAPPTADSRPQEDADSTAATASHTPTLVGLAPAPRASQRQPGVPQPEVPQPDGTIEVLVVDAETRQPVGGATVLHVAPGFARDRLSAKQQDLYSRDAESYLRSFGLSVRCDATGRVRIPRSAAFCTAVVARHEERRGMDSLRDDSDQLQIAVSPHIEVIVETVDPWGTGVPNMAIDAVPVERGFPTIMARWRVGTTDDGGRLVFYAPAPPAEGSRELWLFANVMGKDRGPVKADLRHPLSSPLRLTIPATGRVRVRLVPSSGAPDGPDLFGHLNAEISTSPSELVERRLYRRLDADGWATFDGVELDQDLFLRFPPLVDTPIAFAGPRSGDLDITIVHDLQPEHPWIAGVLVGPDRKPLAAIEFSLFIEKSTGVIAVCGGRTERDGSFSTLLPSSVTGLEGTTLRFGMDWTGVLPGREVTVMPAFALNRRVELGTVEMPQRR